MPTVTLLEKLYGDVSLTSAESQIKSLCEGLRVAVKIVEITEQGWIRVDISGEDEVAALALLRKEFGIAPVDVKNVKHDAIYMGKIVSPRKGGMEIDVDIGVYFPFQKNAVVSLQHLQAQLVDGKKLPLQRIVQLFCFLNNFPIQILIKRLNHEQKHFTGELSEKQITLISEWVNSNLERLVVLGALSKNVKNAIKMSGHFRDVIAVENLGMLEHAIVCKLGTNAIGLIPKVGRQLPNAVFAVFSPKEILHFFKA